MLKIWDILFKDNVSAQGVLVQTLQQQLMYLIRHEGLNAVDDANMAANIQPLVSLGNAGIASAVNSRVAEMRQMTRAVYGSKGRR